MSMFDTYDNLPIDYIPTNITSNATSCVVDGIHLPNKEYNVKGEFVGYTWTHGETFELLFSRKTVIKVKADSLIYSIAGMSPDIVTAGYVGQKSYNTADKKSWTCVSASNGVYVWAEDEELTYILEGTVELDMTPDMTNSELQLELSNFRWEPIHTLSNKGAIDILLQVDKDITEMLKPGVYHCRFKEINGDKVSVISTTTFYVK